VKILIINNNESKRKVIECRSGREDAYLASAYGGDDDVCVSQNANTRQTRSENCGLGPISLTWTF